MSNCYNTNHMRDTVDRKQAGLVSFTVTLIMMMVITLIVLGFSQVVRRNAREALDRQLSSQAFYAAESGVNVTTATLINYVKTNGSGNMATKTTCATGVNPTEYAPGNLPSGAGATITALNAADNIGYSCVLVDPSPPNLQYKKLDAGNSIVVPLLTSGPLTSLTFSWSRQDSLPTNCAPSGLAYTLPAGTDWGCDHALLRVDIVPVPNPSSPNLNGGITKTVFMNPRGDNSGGNVALGGNASYVVSASSCGSGTCTVTVTGLGGTSYYARITPEYRGVDTLTLTPNSGVTFKGVQAVVDVTGKAQDVLRRIQARVSLTATTNSADIPANAVASSATICKKFNILPTANIDLANTCN